MPITTRGENKIRNQELFEVAPAVKCSGSKGHPEELGNSCVLPLEQSNSWPSSSTNHVRNHSSDTLGDAVPASLMNRKSPQRN